jgi:hypothetical protein
MADLNVNTAGTQVTLIELKIILSNGKPVDIRNVYDVLSIFEDIYSPVITGSVQITDALNLFSSSGFHGNEFLRVVFKKPGEDVQYSKHFRIYSCADRQHIPGSQAQRYMLYFCSEEMIFSNQLSISKAYKNFGAETHAFSILFSDLRVNPSKCNLANFEAALGTTEFVFTRTKPIEAIQTLAKYSYGTNNTPFMFYENNEGFNFKSLELMYLSNPIASLNYSTAKLANAVEEAAYVNAFDINKFTFESSFNIHKNTKKAAFAGTLYTLDLVRQKYVENKFSMINPSALKTLIDGKINTNLASNRNGKSVYEEFGSSTKLAMTNLDQSNAPYSLSRGYRVNNTNVERVLLQREMHLAMLNNTKLKCIVQGNPLYTVGYVVEFNLPSFTPEEKNERLLDPYHSGKYLITAVRHTMTRSEGLQTALELSKNSSVASYTNPDGNANYRTALRS